MMKNKCLLLIDGHSLAYRSFYGLPLTITTPEGQPINAVFGFITALFANIESFQPDYVCICFDRKEPTFRHKLYDGYKAQRKPAPEEFKPQVGFIQEIGRAHV